MIEISKDANIKFTYGALIAFVSVVIGFAGWMTSVQLNAQEATTKIDKVEKTQDKLTEVFISIDKRLSRIEVLLERYMEGE